MSLNNISPSIKDFYSYAIYKLQSADIVPNSLSRVIPKLNISIRDRAHKIINEYLIPYSELILIGAISSYLNYKTITTMVFESRLEALLMSVENYLTAFITVELAANCIHFSIPRYSPYLWISGCLLFDPKKTTFNDFKKKLPKRIKGKDLIKIQQFFNKIEFFSKKYDLKSPPIIALAAGSFSGFAGAMTGVGSTPIIAIGANSILCTNRDKLNAIICHELSHIKHKDSLPLMTSEFLTWSTYLIALKTLSLTPPFVTICTTTNLLATYLSSIGFKGCEKRADFEAVKILDSARGLISFFNERKISNSTHLETLEKGNLWQKAKRKIFYDTDGNVRFDVHPPLSERIRYLKKWDKKRISALPFYRRFFARAQNCFRAN